MNVKQILTTVTEWLTATTMMVPSHAVVEQVIQAMVGLVILWVSKSSTLFQIKSYLSLMRGKRRYMRTIIIIIIIIISTITVFAGVFFVHQPGANHAPGASITQVNLSVDILTTFLRIRADPSMQIF